MIDNDIHTTEEESRILMELGVSPTTASYQMKDGVFSENKGEGTPIWGNYDLMLLIPEQIKYLGNYLTLKMTLFVVEYYCWYNIDDERLNIFFGGDLMKNNIIDCIKWLKSVKIPLKNEKQNNEKDGLANFFAFLGGAKQK